MKLNANTVEEYVVHYTEKSSVAESVMCHSILCKNAQYCTALCTIFYNLNSLINIRKYIICKLQYIVVYRCTSLYCYN